ncbi:major facilitator superfamily-domain-containing protein [Xylariaceae sp. FL0255]|nr:major facilitator superfamily-domain-containing protein [Xylariaceae sp. FL0255]
MTDLAPSFQKPNEEGVFARDASRNSNTVDEKTPPTDTDRINTPSSNMPLGAAKTPLTQAELDRLGRQRPAVFSNAAAELGFILTIILSMMMSEYVVGGFNLVLPQVSKALSIPRSQQSWPAAVPNLTTGAVLLPFARLCDIYGARPVFVAGHVWMLIWSIAGGFSPDAIVLIVCRAMQGLGFSAALPAGLALLGSTYRPGPRKNLVYLTYGAFACVGFDFGILIGGVSAQFLSWRWFFYIAAVITAVIIVTAWLTIPGNLDDRISGAAMDWLGLVTVVPGLVLVVYAFSDGGNAPKGWRTPYIYITFIVGVLLLATFVYVEGWVAAQPLLPGAMFKARYMKRLCCGLFCSFGIYGVNLFYSSYYLQSVLHTTPILTAAWFTPLAVGGIILATTGGFVLHLLSGRMLIIISDAGFFLSSLLFALIPGQSTGADGTLTPATSFLYWAYVFSAFIGGTIGVDITFNVTNVYVSTTMPRRFQATAGALINSLIYLGIAFWLGIADLAIGTTLQMREAQGREPLSLAEQYKIAFYTAVGISVASFLFLVSVKFGRAAADLTADEKEGLETDGTLPPQIPLT